MPDPEQFENTRAQIDELPDRGRRERNREDRGYRGRRERWSCRWNRPPTASPSPSLPCPSPSASRSPPASVASLYRFLCCDLVLVFFFVFVFFLFLVSSFAPSSRWRFPCAWRGGEGLGAGLAAVLGGPTVGEIVTAFLRPSTGVSFLSLLYKICHESTIES